MVEGGTPKPILVTGASSGIGKAVTESLSESGSLVYATVRSQKDLNSLRKLPNVHPIMMDVTKLEQVKRGIAEIRRVGSGLYGVVNNAGIIDYWPLVELEDEEVKRSFEVNVLGVQRVVREAAPLLAESRGRVVNISSLEGLASTKFGGLYEMTKFALEAYSDSLSKELRNHGITVVLVEPGEFRTDYPKTTEKLLARRAKTRPPTLMKKEVEQITRTWHEFALFVARQEAPDRVAAAVNEALFSAKPKHRYVVTSGPRDFRWALDRLMSKLIEVNRGSEYGVSKRDLQRLLDDSWAHSRD